MRLRQCHGVGCSQLRQSLFVVARRIRLALNLSSTSCVCIAAPPSTCARSFCVTRSGSPSTASLLSLPAQAAAAMLRGWAQGRFEIHYPRRFTLWMKLLRIMPQRWYFYLVAKATT